MGDLTITSTTRWCQATTTTASTTTRRKESNAASRSNHAPRPLAELTVVCPASGVCRLPRVCLPPPRACACVLSAPALAPPAAGGSLAHRRRAGPVRALLADRLQPPLHRARDRARLGARHVQPGPPDGARAPRAPLRRHVLRVRPQGPTVNAYTRDNHSQRRDRDRDRSRYTREKNRESPPRTLKPTTPLAILPPFLLYLPPPAIFTTTNTPAQTHDAARHPPAFCKHSTLCNKP